MFANWIQLLPAVVITIKYVILTGSLAVALVKHMLSDSSGGTWASCFARLVTLPCS
jgi:hypothetical protein